MGRRPRQQVAPSSSSQVKRASSPPTTPLRQSKRVKTTSETPTTSQTTPKKSQYFEHGDEGSKAESEVVDEESGYENEDASASVMSSPPESGEESNEEEEEYTSEEERPRRGRPAKKSVNGVTVTVGKGAKGQELWRPGVKTGLAPGEQVFIKLPKARQAGKTPYKDDTIHPNTLHFLNDLKENNDREWLKVHDADYRQSKKDFDSFIDCLTEKIIEKDETIPELPPKDLTFRIYRDIRFSPDPTPYKIYFSAAWSRTGRKGPYAHYYVQIQPGGSFVGGGIWHPEAQPLALLRQDVDRKSHKIKKVLMDPGIRKECFKGIPSDEKKAVKAFVSQNSENMLKTKPKGFDADNANIDLLRLRNYTIGCKLKDDEVLGPKGLQRITELIGIMTPFITYLNGVVLPDDDDASSDPGDGEDEEEELDKEEEEAEE